LALYRAAADRGDLRAPECLGFLYSGAAGLPADLVQAAMWYEIATAMRRVEPAAYQGLRKRLTPEQVAEAQARARAWRPAAAAAGTAAPSPLDEPVAQAGSGVVVSERGLIVTTRHVVAGCADIRVSVGDGRSAPAEFVASDPENDIALLRTDVVFDSAAAIAAGSATAGEAVTVVGYPLPHLLGAREGNVSTGIVSALSGPRGDPRFLRLTAVVEPGTSGGAVLDENGGLIGLVVGISSARQMTGLAADLPPGFSFALKSNLVRNFLEDEFVRYKVSAPASAGGAWWNSGRLSPTEVAAIGRRITAQVACGG
jgi:hypothetical protein